MRTHSFGLEDEMRKMQKVDFHVFVVAQECLKHVRSLNEKLASGKYAPDSPELKQGVEALRAVLSQPSPKVSHLREHMHAGAMTCHAQHFLTSRACPTRKNHPLKSLQQLLWKPSLPQRPSPRRRL